MKILLRINHDTKVQPKRRSYKIKKKQIMSLKRKVILQLIVSQLIVDVILNLLYQVSIFVACFLKENTQKGISFCFSMRKKCKKASLHN